MMGEVSVSGNNKRCREESFESEAKRLHADFLLDILDDDDEEDAVAGDRDLVTQDLASVMRSLEEEISLPLPPPPSPPVPAGSASELSDPPRLAELGYLLAASDDELGLPPAASSSSSSSSQEAVDGEEAAESAGFGQIWSFDDEISGCYDGVGFGIRPEEELPDGLVFDDGLFDYADVLFCAPSDFPWRGGSMPTV